MNKHVFYLTIFAATARLALLQAQDLTVDSLFNSGAGPNAPVAAISLQSDGKVLVGGDFTQVDGLEINRLARLNADGSVDSTFHTGAGFDRHVNNIIIDASGKIVVAGDFNSFNNVSAPQLVRLTPNGSVDSSFGWQGRLNGRISSFVIQADGKIVIGGSFESLDGNPRAYLARVNTDGTVDSSFAAAIRSSGAMEGGVDVLTIQADGKLLVGGTFSVNGQFSNLARLNADGSLDTTFAGSPGAVLYASSLRIDSRGHILIGGMASPAGEGFVRRLMADRSADASFGAELAIDGPVRSIAPLADAKIMIAGSFSTLNGASCRGLARLNSDGTVDSTFQLSADGVTTLLAQPDGSVLAAGSFDQINGVSRHYLARLHKVGSVSATSVKLKGGPVTMTWKATLGQNYRIEASADLQSWTSLDTVTATSDRIAYADANSSVTAKRFFRLVSQP